MANMIQKIFTFITFLLIISLANANFSEGLKAIGDGNYEIAIHHFEKSKREEYKDDEKQIRAINLFLGIAYFFAPDHIDNDYKKAFESFSGADSEQDAIVSNVLGDMYLFGVGTEQDYTKAREYFEQATKYKDNEDAIERLIWIHLKGLGVEKDEQKAVEYMLKGDELKNRHAQFYLGLSYELGWGVTADKDKAIEYYKKSSVNGDIDAKYRLKLLTGKLEEDENDVTFREAMDYSFGITKDYDWNKAIELYEIGAKNNHGHSIYNLATYKGNLSKTKFSTENAELTKQAAELGISIAQADLATYYATGLGVKKDKELSSYWEKKAAESGDIESIRETGENYKLGSGVPRNYATAIEWFEKGRALGDGESIFNLARMYEEGEGVEIDLDKAHDYFEEAANAGYRKAFSELADIYLKGKRGKDKNGERSFYWSEKGANAGYADAQNKLAVHYYKGIHVAKDMNKALEWWEKAAEQGNKKAYYNLGNFYDDGVATKRDYKKAFEWFKKAADEDVAKAQYNLGIYYDYGFYVQEDDDKSMEWYEKAAENNDKFAQKALAELYYNGRKTLDKNYQKAADWYKRAAENDENENDKVSKLVPSSYGSGFFVNPNHILTNHHVTDGCDAIEVKNKNYNSIVKLVDSDENTDLSVLVTGVPHNSFLSFRNGKPVLIGEQSIALGYPLASSLGSGLKVTTGNIAALTGYKNNIAELQLTAPVQPGNSGGPLLDNNGNVVGVIVSRLESVDGLKKGRIAQNVNFAIKSNMAKIFMDLNSIDYQVKKPSDKNEVNEIVNKSQDAVVQIICKND